MPVAFCKATFSCKLVCKDEVAGSQNVGYSPLMGLTEVTLLGKFDQVHECCPVGAELVA